MFSEETCVNVLFIGTPGSGKSSTINVLLGRNECASGQTFETSGITHEMKKYRLKLQLTSEKEIGKK